MRPIRIAIVGLSLLLAGLFLLAEPGALATTAFFPLRNAMSQLTGVLAIGLMSAAMILALRPRWLEPWLGGLDKMYRLHKWLGIAALVLSITHWLWAQGPKWAGALGLLTRPARGARPVLTNPVEIALAGWRGFAEGIGQWAFYAAVLLIVVALVKRIPYRFFQKTHVLLAGAYLVLVFHAVVLFKFAYWATPLGIVTGALMAYGAYAAIVLLTRQAGRGRKVEGRVEATHYFSPLRVLETWITLPASWPGHKAGQFAFVRAGVDDGPHPYTMASVWDAGATRVRFITKELGDHTGTLRERLTPGASVTVEGPYGCFTFDDDRPRQIWIGGGIGITPFVARLTHLAAERAAGRGSNQVVDLYHTTADVDPEALARLRRDAEAAGVRLHILVDAQDGFLTGDRIRAEVPDWREASLWFCGPPRFGQALRTDFRAHGFPVGRHFHQELFEMR